MKIILLIFPHKVGSTYWCSFKNEINVALSLKLILAHSKLTKNGRGELHHQKKHLLRLNTNLKTNKLQPVC